MAVDKCQGLKPGQHPKLLGRILIISNKSEPLKDIITNPCRYGPQAAPALVHTEVEREGFPNLSPEDFVKLFCKMNPRTRDGERVTEDTLVNRIVFRRIA